MVVMDRTDGMPKLRRTELDVKMLDLRSAGHAGQALDVTIMSCGRA